MKDFFKSIEFKIFFFMGIATILFFLLGICIMSALVSHNSASQISLNLKETLHSERQ